MGNIMSALGNVSVGLLTSAAIFVTGAQNYMEYLYPVLFLYHILTFTLTYPNSTFLRKLTATFLLSFSDLILTAAIFQLQIPQKVWIFLLEFVVIFYMTYQLSLDEIKSIGAHDEVRLAIFIMAGYLKSVNLVSTLTVMAEDHSLSLLKSFVVLLVVGVAKMAGSVAVYYLDRISLRGRFDTVTLEEIWDRIKSSVLGVCIAIEVCAYYANAINERKFERGAMAGYQDYMFGGRIREIYLVTGMYFAGLYAYKSYQYGVVLKEKLEE